MRPQKIIIRITVTAILATLVIYANFIAIRRMRRYAVELNFYDKLSVAYDIGGMQGLESELAKITAQGNLRQEAAMAQDFRDKLESLKAPEDFIDQALAERKRRIMLLTNFRNIAIALIAVIFVARIFVNRRLIKTGK